MPIRTVKSAVSGAKKACAGPQTVSCTRSGTIAPPPPHFHPYAWCGEMKETCNWFAIFLLPTPSPSFLLLLTTLSLEGLNWTDWKETIPPALHSKKKKGMTPCRQAEHGREWGVVKMHVSWCLLVGKVQLWHTDGQTWLTEVYFSTLSSTQHMYASQFDGI